MEPVGEHLALDHHHARPRRRRKRCAQPRSRPHRRPRALTTAPTTISASPPARISRSPNRPPASPSGRAANVPISMKAPISLPKMGVVQMEQRDQHRPQAAHGLELIAQSEARQDDGRQDDQGPSASTCPRSPFPRLSPAAGTGARSLGRLAADPTAFVAPAASPFPPRSARHSRGARAARSRRSRRMRTAGGCRVSTSRVPR